MSRVLFTIIILCFARDNTASANENLGDFIDQKVEEFDKENVAKIVPRNTKKIIVIDAGHGGKDPGAIGSYARTKEKNLTLSYSKELAKRLKKRYNVYLTRDDDTFVELKNRVQKARKIRADIFISLHANTAQDQGASGLSVYTLSEKSSDKQAEILAQKENRADIISDINFKDTSKDIVKMLIDLSQRDAMNSSARFANTAITSVKNVGIEVLQNSHRFAGFMVLTAPDMASVLIELGYISNHDEEKKLNSLLYKRRLVDGLVDAIDAYFQ
jgi:N-acetylmuramoyl-L-alanine amidase